ncbi:MAG: hypothetical protein MZU79_06900 [Anaerotruncus sp.]|nr:hypothetical protein [Anaerotruncus sp.]
MIMARGSLPPVQTAVLYVQRHLSGLRRRQDRLRRSPPACRQRHETIRVNKDFFSEFPALGQE